MQDTALGAADVDLPDNRPVYHFRAHTWVVSAAAMITEVFGFVIKVSAAKPDSDVAGDKV